MDIDQIFQVHLIDRNIVEKAYLKLKQDSYWDTVDLFLRERLCQFECKHSSELSSKFNEIAEVIAGLIQGEPNANKLVNRWIEQISFCCLPKSIEFSTATSENTPFISNLRSSSAYPLKEVNYFIEAPIELHILDVIWSITAGTVLDRDLDDCCLGNRLERNDDDEHSLTSSKLFKIFHRQYKKWRDGAVHASLGQLNQNNDILMIAMDIKRCYYHLEINWEEVYVLLANRKNSALHLQLSRVLQMIHERYHQVCYEYMRMSHRESCEKIGTPVGFASSRILANWMLSFLDEQIRDELQPIYYGRYVDDILIVMRRTLDEESSKCNAKAIIQNVLSDRIVSCGEGKNNGDMYLSNEMLRGLRIQEKKIIVQYFDHRFSRAGLTNFLREIKDQASEFRFLPEGDGNRSIDECAYDIIYKGSLNKLRSVVEFEENSTELSKYLSRRIIQHRLTSDVPEKEQINQLFRFYKGKNVFDFCRLWEKVFTLFITNSLESESGKFYHYSLKTIGQLTHEASHLLNKVRSDTEHYLQLSIAMPLGLYGEGVEDHLKSKTLLKILQRNERLTNISMRFREANMIRHQYVAYPMLNYTIYHGNILEFDPTQYSEVGEHSLSDFKIRVTPRHIHYHEIAVYEFIKEIIRTHGEICNESIYDSIKSIYTRIDTESEIPRKKGTDVLSIFVPGERNSAQLVVGVANMKVSKKNIERSYHPRTTPNTEYARQAELYQLLNESVRNPQCDILVLPEVSVPVSWMPFVIEQARKRQVGIVFGLEHWVVNNAVLNMVVTVLPYKTRKGFRSAFVSMRVKNHYSPHEVAKFESLQFEIPKKQKPFYERYIWRKTAFSVYNCFELSDIQHRAYFKSDIDYLITVAWNKDIPYYANVIESCARDLHCFVIHANTSEFGDSRITAPVRNEEKDILRVKGGLTPTLLKARIDLEQLRMFQCKKYDPTDKTFKPTPAGYDHAKARKRIISEES